VLNFDEERFLRIQTGALALATEIDTIVKRSLADGAENVFFAGTGGAGILMLPAAALLQAGSTFSGHVVQPAELVRTGTPHLTERSVVVIPSLSGATPESLHAAQYCRARGATVVAMTAHADSALAKDADHVLVNFAEDDTSSESFYLQSLLLVLSFMSERGEFDDYEQTVLELKRLPGLLVEVKRAFEPVAARLAKEIQDDDYHIITGAGGTWAQAFYYGMCILEEMQWIRTRPVHAADFFHGTLELVEEGVSVVLFKGEDEGRELVERVERFVTSRTSKVRVLDAADLALPGISAPVRSLISPVTLATVLERLSAHLEVLRDHPLTTRRYYKRVPY
jgi:fructoselysine-6-phosphate deglycase